MRRFERKKVDPRRALSTLKRTGGGESWLHAPILKGLIDGLERLASHEDVWIETLLVHPPSGGATDGLPDDWRAFYEACDGIQVRWRHRHSRRDQDHLNGKRFSSFRKRKVPRPIPELGYSMAGRIEIGGLATIVGRNVEWDEVVEGIELYCDPGLTLDIDGEQVPWVDAYRRIRPFDRFDSDASICVRLDNFRLLYNYQNKTLDFGVERECNLATYLAMLGAHGGAVEQRAQTFANGAVVPTVDLDNAETLLLDDYAPDLVALASTFDPASFWEQLRGIELYSDAYYEREKRLQETLFAFDGDKVLAFCHAGLADLATGAEHPFEDYLLGVIRSLELYAEELTPAQDAAVLAALEPLIARFESSRFVSLKVIFEHRGDSRRLEALVRTWLAHEPDNEFVLEQAKEAGIEVGSG